MWRKSSLTSNSQVSLAPPAALPGVARGLPDLHTAVTVAADSRQDGGAVVVLQGGQGGQQGGWRVQLERLEEEGQRSHRGLEGRQGGLEGGRGLQEG